MISRLFRSRKRVVERSVPRVPVLPEGVVVWAVGDIHGRLDLLAALVEALIADAHAMPGRKVVIFLGDYVDRGPDSRGVLRYLSQLPDNVGIEWRFLKGNHEEAMISFIEHPGTGPRWVSYGGDAALGSYGLAPPSLRHKTEAWVRVAADLDHKLAPSERSFLDNLELSITLGDYFFVHAGVRPGVPLEQQTEDDMLWIRRSFLDSDEVLEKIIVHGHTPTQQVHVDPRRLGVDTKAYESGVLTALHLVGAERRLVQTRIAEPGGDIQIVRSDLTVSPSPAYG